jgi:tetratricopeptide (TPR) repeat protein
MCADPRYPDDARPPDEDTQQALQATHALAADGRYALAFAHVERLLASRPAAEAPPAAATALAAVARAAERGGDGVTARRALETALSLVDWADLHLALARLLDRDGERRAAREHCERALAINPRFRAAAVELALLDAREGHVSDAVHALRTLSGGSSTLERESLRQGLERLREAAVEDAAPLLRRAFTGGDEALEALLGNAQASFASGDTAAGLASLRRAVAERPGYADLHAVLGSHELRAGHLDDGIATLVQALELNPDFHSARLELARGLEARGDRDAALHELNQVLEVEPSHADAATFLARLTVRRRASAPATN